jgi:predicted metal-binding membrane protein
VTAGLVGMAVLAWLYLLRLARALPEMDMGMAMPQMQSWGLIDLLLVFVMWVIMMIAMMIPSAAPMILMFTTIYRRRADEQRPVVGTGIFLAGYLVIWTAYAALASVAQWGLHGAALLSPTMASTSSLAGGGLLVAAGIFQWTPLKQTCLANCRSPLSFLMTEWRDGKRGAFVMGLRHGAYCVGCCWVLMALLFVAGVMNLVWVAAIAAFVLVEKVIPGGGRISRVAGVALLVAGLLVMTQVWQPAM